jgi:hypothetical protein
MKEKAPNIDFEAHAKAHFQLSEIKDADFHEWARKGYWSAEECVALIFRKDPHQCNRQKIEDIFPADLVEPFAQNYIAAHEQILAAQRNKELPERIRPTEFLAWARQYKNDFSYFLVPYLLEKAVSANDLDIAQLQDRYENLRRENQELRYEVERLRNNSPSPEKEVKEVSPRERISMYKLIVGMAMDGYGWVPTAARSPVPKEISVCLKDKGLHLDEDTVHKYLHEAKDVLP